jgi:hypothetical protein
MFYFKCFGLIQVKSRPLIFLTADCTVVKTTVLKLDPLKYCILNPLTNFNKIFIQKEMLDIQKKKFVVGRRI